jgi:hypothetical protein
LKLDLKNNFGSTTLIGTPPVYPLGGRIWTDIIWGNNVERGKIEGKVK